MLSFLCNAIYPNFSISPDKQPNKTKSKVLSLRRLLTLTNRVKRDVLDGEGDNFISDFILDLRLLLGLNTLRSEITRLISIVSKPIRVLVVVVVIVVVVKN